MITQFIAVYGYEECRKEDLKKCDSFLNGYELKYGIKRFEEKSTRKNEKPELANMQTDISEGLVTVVVVSSLDRLSKTKNGLKGYLNFLKEHNTGLVSLKEKIEIDFTKCII